MRTIAFVVNDLIDFTFEHLIKKYLGNANVTIANHFPCDPQQFDLVVLWSYRQVVPHRGTIDNVIIFHSSDLPNGRGWAPIYHALADKNEYFTITGIKMSNPVDTGDVVVKAKFFIRPDYTAALLRRFDEELSILLAARILDRFGGERIAGRTQQGIGSYFPRRKPEQNIVDLTDSLENLIPKLRACEPSHPAHFIFHGKKYIIEIYPEIEPQFPEDIEIEFFD